MIVLPHRICARRCRPRLPVALVLALAFFAISPNVAAQNVVPIGPSFKVQPGGGSIGGRPAIAFDGANFLAVWRDSASDAFATRVTAVGGVLDASGIRLSTVAKMSDTAVPSVVFDGTHYVIVWTSAGEIFGTILHPDGTVVASEVQITSAAEARSRPITIAFDGTNFLIAWRTLGDEIRATRVAKSSGTLSRLDSGNGFLIGIGFYPWVAFGNGQYLVAWHAHGAGGLDVLAARVSTAGVVQDPGGFVVSNQAGDEDHVSVAASGSNYLVAFRNAAGANMYTNGRGYAVRVSPAGAVLDTPPIRIADDVSHQVPMLAVFDGTNYFTAWHVDVWHDYRLNDVMGRRVSVAGQVLDTQAIPVGTSYGHQAWAPALGYGNGRFLAAWGDSHRASFCYNGCIGGQILEKTAPGAPPATDRAAIPSAPPAAGEPSWTTVPSPTSSFLYAVHALDDATAFATQEGGAMLRYDGANWGGFAGAPSTARDYGLWANAPTDLWSGGWGFGINRFNGAGWQQISFHDPATGTYPIVMGAWSSGRQVLVVGTAGYAVRYDGTTWIPQGTISPFDLRDVWGTSPTNAYAVGERGTVMRWDGSTWTPVTGIPTIQSLNSLWGTSANDIFVVGDFGTILHYDGTTWSAQASGTTEHLFGVRAVSPTEVYAVGYRGTILRYNGTSWSAEVSGTSMNLLDVSFGADRLWAVGDQGTILEKTLAQGSCTRALSATSITVGASGGPSSVSLTTTCSWTAWSNASWIALTSLSSGTGDTTVTMTIEPNTSASARTATLIIAGQTFTINQDASSCTYHVSPVWNYVPPAGTSGPHGPGWRISVETGTGCAWIVKDPQPEYWLDILDVSTSSGTGTVTFHVTQHNDIDNPQGRSHTIEVAGQTVNIYQTHRDCQFAIDPTSRTVGAAAGTYSVNVTTSGWASCPWMAFSQNDFLTVSGPSTGENAGTVSYTVPANPSSVARSGTITIAGIVHSITQSATPCVASVAPNTPSIGAAGGTFQVELTMNPSDCAWQTNSNAPWLTMITQSGQGSASINYSATANPDATARVGTFTVAGETITVTQAGTPAVCNFTLSATNTSVSAAAATGTVDVTATNASCTWNAVSNDGWLTITSGANSTGSGSVTFAAAATSIVAPRTGTLNIAGQTFTVTQAGCAFTVAPTAIGVSASGTTGSITVTTTSACPWTATAHDAWLVVTAGSTGPGTADYAVAQNTSTTARAGTLTVAGQTVTITQGGAPLVLLAPVDLVASVVGSTVTASWSMPAGGIAPTGFVLEGGTFPGDVRGSIATGSTATSITFSGPTGTFYIRVHALAGDTRSAASNEVLIAVNVPAVPAAPVGLTGEAYGSHLRLAWRNMLNQGAPSAMALDVSGPIAMSLPLPASESFSFSGVPPGTYTFAVRALNAWGSSGASNAVTLTFPASCATPGVPVNFVASKSGNTISVSWAPPASGPTPTGYTLNVTGSYVASIPTTSLALAGAVGPGSYTISVVAIHPCGTSAPTTAQTVTIP